MVAAASSTVKEASNVQQQIGSTGPSTEKPSSPADSKTKAEPKPQVGFRLFLSVLYAAGTRPLLTIDY